MSLWNNLVTSRKHSYFENFEFFRNANDLNNFLTIYLVEKGSFNYKIGSEKWDTVCEKQAVICPPNVNFSKVVNEKITMHIIRLGFDDTKKLPSGKFSFDGGGRILENLNKLRLLICQHDLPTENLRRHLIDDIWYTFLAEIESPYIKYENKPSDNLFLEMVNYVNDNLDASLEKIANAFNLSRVAVNNRFRKNTGKSVGSYVQEMRVKRACKLIEQTDYPFRYIAPACGFSNEYYFSATFTKLTGISPGKYRKKFLQK
ncbi:MAG: helix-turn-helix transcriptional regulator [Clostridia bacterium]|nr:helix-turn-helix transcriptional regulator [Clostridia bacterium]